MSTQTPWEWQGHCSPSQLYPSQDHQAQSPNQQGTDWVSYNLNYMYIGHSRNVMIIAVCFIVFRDYI